MNNVELLGKEENSVKNKAMKLDSVGEILKYHRELKGLSLDKVAKDTYIKLKYLSALENDLSEVMPAPVYVYSYIKHYSKLLGLDGSAMVKLYQEQNEFGEPSVSRSDKISDGSKGSFERDFLFNNTMEFNNLSENVLDEVTSSLEPQVIAKEEVRPAYVEIKPIDEPTSIQKPEISFEEPVVKDAKLEAERIIALANQEAKQIILRAQEEAEVLRSDSHNYAENVLKNLESNLFRVFEEIKNGRSFLNGSK